MKIAPGPGSGEAGPGPKAARSLGAGRQGRGTRAESGVCVPPRGRRFLSADHTRARSDTTVLLARSGSGGSARAEGALARRRRGGVRGPKRSPPARPAGPGRQRRGRFGNRRFPLGGRSRRKRLFIKLWWPASKIVVVFLTQRTMKNEVKPPCPFQQNPNLNLARSTISPLKLQSPFLVEIVSLRALQSFFLYFV